MDKESRKQQHEYEKEGEAEVHEQIAESYQSGVIDREAREPKQKEKRRPQ